MQNMKLYVSILDKNWKIILCNVIKEKKNQVYSFIYLHSVSICVVFVYFFSLEDNWAFKSP